MKEFIETLGVEYVEYAVRDIAKSAELFRKMSFTEMGSRKSERSRSTLYQQGDIRIILTASDHPNDAAHQFTRKHGDGILTMAFQVPDARTALERAVQKGATPVPTGHIDTEWKSSSGATLQQTALAVFGSVRNAFVSHDAKRPLAQFFTEGSTEAVEGRPRQGFLQNVDHLTVNLEKGELNRWADFYADLFGFTQVRYFDIRTGKTGLLSRAMRSPNGAITMPFNEPTDPKSQIQEFVDTLKGPGVQHLAFHTSNIIVCLNELRRKGFPFLTVPQTYYEQVKERVPNVTEDMKELMRLGILVDGTPKGYLLQIFTEPLVGPFFFEFIQRKGDNGFGDGNFRALFESIERDQERRGVL